MFDVGGSRDFTSSDIRVRKWTLWDKRFNVKGRKYHILEHFVCSSWQLFLNNWAASSEFGSSSIPSWEILSAHAQPLRDARDLAFCLEVPLYSLLVWASSGGSGETVRMRRLAWTFAARMGDIPNSLDAAQLKGSCKNLKFENSYKCKNFHKRENSLR